mmetsp:Transcript_3908/g.8604  ORF Transcript_3908/g.8604 Transcript_3908/m.8604 type:complete len:341 (-) Transcript_3908:777-1799(-)
MCRHAHGSLESLVQHLAKRRVRVHHHAQLLHRRARRHGIGTLLNQIGSVNSNNVHRHNLPGTLVIQNLGHSIPLQLCQRLGIGAEAPLALAKLPPLLRGELDRLLLGGTHHGDLGMGEARGRDGVVVDLVGPAADVLDGADSLGRGGVGKHHLAVGVADAVDAGNDLAVVVFGEDSHLFVDGDEASGGFDAGFFESHVGRVGDAAGGDHGGVDFEGFDMFLGLSINHLDSHRLLPRNPRRNLARKNASPVIDGPLPNQEPLGLLGNLPVEGGHDVGQGLDEGDLAAQGGVDVGEFESDVAGSDDGDPFGYRLEFEGAVGGVHGLLVDGDSGGYERDGSRG